MHAYGRRQSACGARSVHAKITFKVWKSGWQIVNLKWLWNRIDLQNPWRNNMTLLLSRWHVSDSSATGLRGAARPHWAWLCHGTCTFMQLAERCHTPLHATTPHHTTQQTSRGFYAAVWTKFSEVFVVVVVVEVHKQHRKDIRKRLLTLHIWRGSYMQLFLDHPDMTAFTKSS